MIRAGHHTPSSLAVRHEAEGKTMGFPLVDMIKAFYRDEMDDHLTYKTLVGVEG